MVFPQSSVCLILGIFTTFGTSAKILSLDPNSKRIFLSEGIRQDNRLVRCDNSDLKMSFPDIDYALSGYDIVKGYPLTTARDPGFRNPIFKADYVNGGPNGDCRYMLPKGINAVPDVSCDVSFKSDIIKTTAEFHQALSTSANVEGGGYGFQFSGSASYQKSSSDMSSKDFVYIISRAQCTSYFSRMDFSNPPTFHEGFIQAVKKLISETYDSTEISKFISVYGTHFVDEMTFGSTYTKQHRVKEATFKTLSESKINVAAQASYSGLISAGGGTELDKEQSEAASNFEKNVETITVSVGSAPPSNGDSMKWASTVKENPVPISYSLKPIADLFTAQFMTGIPDIDKTAYNAIHEKLKNAPMNSCNYLKSEGKILTCDSSRNWQMSEVVTIHGGHPLRVPPSKYQYVDLGTYESCHLMCSNIPNCVGFVQTASTICLLANDATTSYFKWRPERSRDGFKLFRNKMKDDLILKYTVPKITNEGKKLYAYKLRFTHEIAKAVAVKDCQDICVKDAFCKGFLITYGSCNKVICQNRDCYLYHDISNLPPDSEEQEITKEFHFIAK